MVILSLMMPLLMLFALWPVSNWSTFCGAGIRVVSFAAARSGVTQRSPSPRGCFKPTYIPFPLLAIFLLGPISILLLYTLHQSQHSLASCCFLSRKKSLAACHVLWKELQRKSRKALSVLFVHSFL